MKIDTKINSHVVVNSFIWKLSERIVSQGISLIIQIILARLIYPKDFGSLVLIVAFINFASIFVQSGLSTAIVQKKKLHINDIATAYTSSLGIATIMYGLLFILAPYVGIFYDNYILIDALRILSLVLFLNAINSVQTAILMRRMDFKIIFFRSFIAVGVSGIISIVMASLGYGLWALIAYNLVNMTMVVLVINFTTDIKIILGISKRSFHEIYNFSGKIMISNLISGAYDFIRTMIIGKKYSYADLAFYDKANTYSFYLISIVNSSISSVLLPTFSSKQDDALQLSNLTRQSIQVTSFIMIPIFIGVISVSELLVSTILTNKWIGCVPYLVVYCIFRIPGCIINIDKQLYYALGRSDIVLYYEVFLIIANLISIYFCLNYGVLIILLGSCLVEYLGFIIICIITQELFGYSILRRVKDIFKTLVATFIMYLCIEFLKNTIGYTIITLPIIIICGVIFYLLFSYILRNRSLLLILHKFVKKR